MHVVMLLMTATQQGGVSLWAVVLERRKFRDGSLDLGWSEALSLLEQLDRVAGRGRYVTRFQAIEIGVVTPSCGAVSHGGTLLKETMETEPVPRRDHTERRPGGP
jgi:hypothetical protein